MLNWLAMWMTAYRCRELAAFFLSAVTFVVQAQPSAAGATPTAGIGVGGQVSTQSDVEMAVQSVPGTHASRFEELSLPVRDNIDSVRQCYQKGIKDNPTLEGTLSLRMDVAARQARPRFSVVGGSQKNQPLASCVLKGMQKLRVAKFENPSAMILSITFHNASAKGTEVTQSKKQALATAAVVPDGSGGLKGSDGTLGKEITFELTPLKGSVASEKLALAKASSIVKDRVGGLLDCRRKAAKFGSMAGVAEATLRFTAGSPASAKLLSNTLKGPKAESCIESVLRGIRTHKAALELTGEYTLKILFNEESP